MKSLGYRLQPSQINLHPSRQPRTHWISACSVACKQGDVVTVAWECAEAATGQASREDEGWGIQGRQACMHWVEGLKLSCSADSASR